MSCLAVVLNGPKAKNGRRVFESFVEQNKMSFWNRELVTAAESLIYMGFMRPGTLFISGDLAQLQVLKDAWARRVLKPAIGYTIASLGDLGAIQQVEQMHFVPLGDVICDAVAQLNRTGQPATEVSIRQYVARHCAHVAPPGIEMVRQTLNSLLATGFIYKMGEHYFVSVPTNSPPKQKQTVECQTGQSIMVQEQKKEKRGILARLFTKGGTKAVRPATQTMPQPVPMVHVVPTINAPNPPPKPLAPLPVPTATAKMYQEPIQPPKRVQKNSNNRNNNEAVVISKKQQRRTKRRETAKLLSSSSECLNYGPIDPPEMLPGCYATQKQTYKNRVPTTKYPPITRTSTPIGSDSAYSPSPVTDSNEEASQSDPEINHTYINLVKPSYTNDSTQFEDLTAMSEEPQILATQMMRGVLISNL